MEWDDLRCVLALYRDRQLGRAAARLGVSHTTIGRRVRALEEELGARLFDRTPEGYVPTAAGQDIAEVAERMEAEVLSLEGRVLGRDEALDGCLRVTTMDMVLDHHHAVFASFVARYPSIELTVTSSDTELSLTRREADVALRLTRTPPPYLVGRKVGRFDFAVYASATLFAEKGGSTRYADYPWLHWDERLNMRWLDEWLAANAEGARVALRVDVSTLQLRELVASGIGVHFLATAVGDADPRLRRVGDVQEAYSRELWLLTLAELRHNRRVRAFMDHVDEALRRGPA